MSKHIGRGRRRTQEASLARIVPHLAPETLHQLIRHSGLDASVEIVAAATPAQLASVFDLDLWRHAQPGDDEQFDVDRFGEWLELLADAGGGVAARTVAAMDEDLVTAGLSRYIRVLDPATLEPSASTDDELVDRGVTSHAGLECELGGYLVRAIRTDAWDAIVALLLALEADHHERFHAAMRGCRRLSNSTPEIDGLDDLLTEPEQLFHDVALDRDHRRSQQGYSTPADARAFLHMARQRQRPSTGAPSVNPIVAAYFRAADDPVASGAAADPDATRPALDSPAAPADLLEARDAVVDRLAEAGLVTPRPRALVEGTPSRPIRLAHIRTLMESVRDRDDLVYARNRELAFLANTLVAGCSIQSRSLTPQEASEAAVATCNLGLEHWPSGRSDRDCVTAFEVGWAVLHEAVGMFVADELILALSDVQCLDAEIQDGLNALRTELTRERRAGTPWRARHALEVIAMLDLPVWTSLLGLLDECPVIPAALTATLEGRTSAVSATEFEFISTRSQLDTVREFMARLPGLLR